MESNGLTGSQLQKLQTTLVGINTLRDHVSAQMNSPVALSETVVRLAVLVDDLSDLAFIVEGYAENFKADLYNELKTTKITKTLKGGNREELMGVTQIQEEIKRNKTAIENDLLVDKLKTKVKNMTTLMTICQSSLRIKAGSYEGKY